ncbi:MAG: hypothetical protein RBU21_08960, partial [FCB group bacterium]|nr:hypothetical protein [FCB group bacterium]
MPSRVVFIVIAALIALLCVQTYRVNRLKADLAVREALSPAALAATEAPSLAHPAGKASSADAANAQTAGRQGDEEMLDALFGPSSDDDSPQAAADKLVQSLEAEDMGDAALAATKQNAAEKKAADRKATEKEKADRQREAKAIANKVRELVQRGDFDGAANLLRESIENGMATS